MARRTRNEMSGFFDWWKRQKSLFDVFSKPSSSGGLIPASKQELSPVDVFRSKPQLPARIEPSPRGLTPAEALKPKLPVRSEERRKEKTELRLLPQAPPVVSRPMSEVAREAFSSQRSQQSPVPKYTMLPSTFAEPEPKRKLELIVAPQKKIEWMLPTPQGLAEHFRRTNNLEAMWDYIRQNRNTPEWKKDQLIASWQGAPMILPLDPVVYREEYTDFANFYGIPWDVMGAYLSVPPEREKEARDNLFGNVISPLNAMVPEAFDLLKPQDIPGFFNVSFVEPSGEYYLFYIEPLLGIGG